MTIDKDELLIRYRQLRKEALEQFRLERHRIQVLGENPDDSLLEGLDYLASPQYPRAKVLFTKGYWFHDGGYIGGEGLLMIDKHTAKKIFWSEEHEHEEPGMCAYSIYPFPDNADTLVAHSDYIQHPRIGWVETKGVALKRNPKSYTQEGD